MIVRETFGRWSVEIETHGMVRFDVQPTNGRHRHDFVEICLVIQGSGRYIHGQGDYKLSLGDVFVADPGILHEISSHETRDLQLWFLTLSFQSFEAKSTTLEDAVVESYLKRHRTHAKGHGSLAHFLPLVEARGTDLDRAAASMATRYLALGMLQALSNESPRVEALDARDPVDVALDLIERHLDSPVSAEQLAGLVGVSVRTLRRRFVARVGVGIAEETNHRRMRRAAHLLLMGFGVSEVGRRVGIDSPAQFSRAFRRAMGVAPKAFQSEYMVGGVGGTTRP